MAYSYLSTHNTCLVKNVKKYRCFEQSLKKVNDSFNELKPNTRNFDKISFNASKKNCTETKVYTS